VSTVQVNVASDRNGWFLLNTATGGFEDLFSTIRYRVVCRKQESPVLPITVSKLSKIPLLKHQLGVVPDSLEAGPKVVKVTIPTPTAITAEIIKRTATLLTVLVPFLTLVMGGISFLQLIF